MASDAARASPATITGIALGPYETNCYVISHPGSGACWIVDASFDPGEIVGHVRENGLTPEALILTHAHVDHIAGVDEVRAAFPGLPVWVHEAEADWLCDPVKNLSAFSGEFVTARSADRLLREGDRLTLAGEDWLVLHTPGHSPGGITLWHAASGTALVGDTLFAGSVGRTDFPGSDPRTLAKSIRERLYSLPDETRVFPGHGLNTTIGREKRTNPYVRA